jgi:hypothetical protein
MNMNTLAHRDAASHGRLRLFSLCVDFPASVRARGANSTISQFAGGNWVVSSELWKLDSLESSPAIRKMATEEAAKADIIAVAASSLNYREHELVAWLESLTAAGIDRQNTGLLIGLFGDDDDRTGELDWTVKEFLNCSRRMDRNFLWHWMETGAMKNHAWLTDKLEPFLDRKRLETGKALLSELSVALA